jgi:hypothetical protein
MKVKLSFQIHGCFGTVSTLDVFMKKEVQMPFYPQVGLEIFDGGDLDCVIESLSYDITKNVLTAYCGEDTEIGDAELRHQDHRPIDEIVKEYENQGWEVDER